MMPCMDISTQHHSPAAQPVAKQCVARTVVTIMVLLAAPLAIVGCASPQDTVRGNGAVFEVLEERTLKPDAEVQCQILEPTRATTERWAPTGDGAPFEIRTSVSGNAGSERWTRSDPVTTRVLARNTAGDVTLIEQTDASDGATTRFQPPLVLAPALLRAGEECTSTSVVQTIRGNAIDNEGGRAQRSVKLTSYDRIRTPLGEFNALRIDAVFTMKVPFASMRRETSTWVRSGDGPVAIRSVEKILVMGVVPRNRSETRVRLPATGVMQ